MEFSPNLQLARHGRLADGFRRLAYRWLIGLEDWLPIFRRPGARADGNACSLDAHFHQPFCETICPHCSYNKARFRKSAASACRSALLKEISS